MVSQVQMQIKNYGNNDLKAFLLEKTNSPITLFNDDKSFTSAWCSVVVVAVIKRKQSIETPV